MTRNRATAETKIMPKIIATWRITIISIFLSFTSIVLAQDDKATAIYYFQKGDKVVFKEKGLALFRRGWLKNEEYRIYFNGEVWIVDFVVNRKVLDIGTQPEPSHLAPLLQPNGTVRAWFLFEEQISFEDAKITSEGWMVNAATGWVLIDDLGW